MEHLHLTLHIYSIQSKPRALIGERISWQGMGPPSRQRTSGDEYIGVQQEHLATQAKHDRPLTIL